MGLIGPGLELGMVLDAQEEGVVPQLHGLGSPDKGAASNRRRPLIYHGIVMTEIKAAKNLRSGLSTRPVIFVVSQGGAAHENHAQKEKKRTHKNQESGFVSAAAGSEPLSY